MQKTKTQKVLPKTAREIQNGGLYVQSVRCGKRNCKCSRGETHSAYYFFTRRKGKLIKIYVPKSEVIDFSRLIQSSTNERKEHRRTSNQANESLKKFRQSLLENASYINSLKEI